MYQLANFCFIQLSAFKSVQQSKFSTIDIIINQNSLQCQSITKFIVTLSFDDINITSTYAHFQQNTKLQLSFDVYIQKNVQLSLTFDTGFYKETQFIQKIQVIPFLIQDCLQIKQFLLSPINGIRSFYIQMFPQTCPEFMKTFFVNTPKIDWVWNNTRSSLLTEKYAEAPLRDQICSATINQHFLHNNIQLFKCCYNDIFCNFRTQQLIGSSVSQIQMIFYDQVSSKYYSHQFNNILTTGTHVSNIITQAQIFVSNKNILLKIELNSSLTNNPYLSKEMFLIFQINSFNIFVKSYHVKDIPTFINTKITLNSYFNPLLILQFQNLDNSVQEKKVIQLQGSVITFHIQSFFLLNQKLYLNFTNFERNVLVQIKLQNYINNIAVSEYFSSYQYQLNNQIIIESKDFIRLMSNQSEYILSVNNVSTLIQLQTDSSIKDSNFIIQTVTIYLIGFVVIFFILCLMQEKIKL